MTDSTTISFRNTNNSDRHYLHSIFKHKAYYYHDDEDKAKDKVGLRIYFFENEKTTDHINKSIDRSKLSNTADYFRGSYILPVKHTSDEGEDDPEQGLFKTQRCERNSRKRQKQTEQETKTETSTAKTGTVSKSDLSSDSPATANQNAEISKPTNDSTGASIAPYTAEMRKKIR